MNFLFVFFWLGFFEFWESWELRVGSDGRRGGGKVELGG